MKGDLKARERNFSAKSFFLSMMALVAGTNKEGYLHALANVFHSLKADDLRPSKSAFSQARAKVKHELFKDAYKSLAAAQLKTAHKFMGLRIYAIDGQQHILPRSADIVANGSTGRATAKHKETYYPKAHFTHAYEVINGISCGFTYNAHLHEQADARQLIKGFEKESLTIYDRLFFSEKMVSAHQKHGSYYLMRCRRNCHSAVGKLLNSTKKIRTEKINNKTVYFIRIKNQRQKHDDVYATNLPKRFHSPQLLQQLYKLRWEVETSFRELTEFTKLEQWHSKSYNGIMQELCALLWLINASRATLKICHDLPLDPTKTTYSKSNFKLAFNLLACRLHELWHNFRKLIAWLTPLIKESTEKRKRYSRLYPRQVRRPASPYPRKSTEWMWDKGYSFN